MVWPDGSPQLQCPRYIARTQVERLEKIGYKLLSSFEIELLVLDRETEQPIFKDADWSSSMLMFENQSLLHDLDKKLLRSGVQMTSMLPEGGLGQLEVTLKPAYGLASADDTFRFKQACKEVCHLHNTRAVFMTKYLYTEGSQPNGFHFNHSLWDMEGKDVFFDANQPNYLSNVARYWIGGLIKHSAALTALCCPTFNCYRRLHRDRKSVV